MRIARQRANGKPTPHGRRGVQTVEIIVALPIVFIATLAVFEFGMLFLFQQAVGAATIEGVRDAAKGGSLASVQAVVNQFLQPYGINIQAGSSDANIRLETGTPATNATLNGNTCLPSGPASVLADEVRVTVCLRLVPTGGTSAWGTNDGVPNWLSKYGFSLSSHRFEVSALAKTEF
jgi:Flp pilus assembly protein TadG